MRVLECRVLRMQTSLATGKFMMHYYTSAYEVHPQQFKTQNHIEGVQHSYVVIPSTWESSSLRTNGVR